MEGPDRLSELPPHSPLARLASDRRWRYRATAPPPAGDRAHRCGLHREHHGRRRLFAATATRLRPIGIRVLNRGDGSSAADMLTSCAHGSAVTLTPNLGELERFLLRSGLPFSKKERPAPEGGPGASARVGSIWR